ncbi:uncharacterized protein LOC132543385 [Ylistrum balloti]|uniref:uncharacterized protein LOC132543385 n=1 Tax=Ylistrum balloti TaxID=509963 RepID=UPI002905E0BF|nr:uncharacterized protein LOC132543385 [Ylistrum balloti]
MPKRRNPFGDSSPLQLKTHVGQKELADGISGKEHLKAVYERTRQMLFSGATKNKTNAMITDANDNNITFPSQSPPQTVPTITLSGQMCLTTEGQLTMSALSTQEMAVDMGVSQMVPSATHSGQMCLTPWGQLAMANAFTQEMAVDMGVSQRVPSKTLPGQMCIDQTGQLTTPAPQEQMSVDTDPCPPKSFDFFKMNGKGKFPGKKTCQSNRSKCGFCEKMVDKVQQCCNCQAEFCHLCSTSNYDECMERIFCLSCNP